MGSLHPGQGMIPVSERLKRTSECVVVDMLPLTLGGSVTDLSVTDRCRWRGGDEPSCRDVY
jgi:hypothetical protein